MRVRSEGSRIELEGVVLPADVRNSNGHLYPLALLERVAQTFTETKIPLYGSLAGYLAQTKWATPPGPAGCPPDASHRITSLRVEGGRLVATASVLTTMPAGMHLVRLLLLAGAVQEREAPIAFILIGKGTVGPDGIIQDDFTPTAINLRPGAIQMIPVDPRHLRDPNDPKE